MNFSVLATVSDKHIHMFCSQELNEQQVGLQLTHARDSPNLVTCKIVLGQIQ